MADEVPGLYQMAQGGDQTDPYGGKTLAQIVLGGLPYNMNADANGRPMGGSFDPGAGGGFDANAWVDRLATNENVSDAIQRGGQYRPEVAKTLQSSGPEGGWFSIGTTGRRGGNPGVYSDEDNPAPGLMGMSTNNWRLLPKQYQDPRYAMRGDHLIDKILASNYFTQLGYVPFENRPQSGANLSPMGGGLMSFGYPFAPASMFYPGQLDPGTPLGGSAGMGSGVT